MAREEDWGARRPNTRARKRKPYNDDYKDDEYSVRDRVRRNYTQDDDYDFDSRRYEGRGRRGAEEDYGYEDERRSSRSYEDDRRSSRVDDRRRPYDDYEEDRRRARSYEDEASRSRRSRSVTEEEDRRRRSRSAADEEARSRRASEGRRERAPRKKRGGGCLPVVVILVLLLAVAVGGIAYVASLWGKVDPADFRSADIEVNPDLPASIREEQKNYRTFMIFGVDSRDNNTLQAGTLADSNIIVSINKKTGKVKLLSIYRDTYVETTAGETMKLTEVYNKYGAKEQLATINKNFDLNVTEYVTVNWKTVADTINMLGGLDIELSEGECQGINKYIDEVIDSTGVDSSHVDVSEGTQHLDGVQAVTYCRLRKGLGDDYKRTERQRTVVTKTLAAAQSAGVPTVLKVCNTVFPGLSSSFSLPEVLTLATGMGRYDIEDSSGFPFDGRDQEGGRYYMYPITLASNDKKLHEYLYNNTEYEPSGTVQELSRKIEEVAGN